MELINEVLVKKLIMLDRSGGVPDVEKSMEELNNALEQYWEKWEILRKENAEVLMKVDLALEQKVRELELGLVDLGLVQEHQAMIPSYVSIFLLTQSPPF